jgi:hypothetical protein
MLENERELSAAQRDSDAGALKTLRVQLESSKMALENTRLQERNEQDARFEALLEQIHGVERQRNDLISEKQAWRAEKEAMVEHLMVQIESIRKERDAYKNECIRLSAELSDVEVRPMKSTDRSSIAVRGGGLLDAGAGSGGVDRAISSPVAISVPSSVSSQIESSKSSVLSSFSVSSDRFMGVIKKMTQPKRSDDGASIRSDLDSSSASTDSMGASQTKIAGSLPPQDDSFQREKYYAGANKTVNDTMFTAQFDSGSTKTSVAPHQEQNIAELPTVDAASEVASPSNSDEEDDAIAAALSKALNLVQEVRRSETTAVAPKANKR